MPVLLQRPDINEQNDNRNHVVCMNEPDTVFTTQLYFNTIHSLHTVTNYSGALE